MSNEEKVLEYITRESGISHINLVRKVCSFVNEQELSDILTTLAVSRQITRRRTTAYSVRRL